MIRLFAIFLAAAAFATSARAEDQIAAQQAPTTKALPEFLKEFGFDVRQQRQDNQTFYVIGKAAMPSQIVTEVLATPLRDLLTVTGNRSVTEPILRFNEVVFNPKGVLTWSIPDRSNDGNYVVLAAKKLVLNTPAQLSELARLVVNPHLSSADLKGSDSRPGPQGWTSGTDDGANGGRGGNGPTGGNGGAYTFPAIYIVFQSLEINTANPAITSALRIESVGLAGGAGGRGGDGGPGGPGSRGTPGDRNCPLPGVCYCTAGPGNGGNGGDGGSGGKGGDSGRGGAGGSIFFLGPLAELNKTPRIEISQTGGKSGAVGMPGSPGGGGPGGGGGSKPFECVNGGGSGSGGSAGSPPNLGPGLKKPDGLDGAAFKSERDNSDLF